jgi:hypothetical protein
MVQMISPNRGIQIAVLYFAEEALGYRHTLHFLRRWFEESNNEDLRHLLLNIAKENFLDWWAVSQAFGGDVTAVEKLINDVRETKNITVVKQASELVGDQPDVMIELVKLLTDSDSMMQVVVDEDLEIFSQQITKYFGKKKWAIEKLIYAIKNTKQPVNWSDALSRNQIKSKKWLLDKLQTTNWFKSKNAFDLLPTLILVGGWVSMLTFLAAIREIKFTNVVNIDIDENIHLPATMLNGQLFADFKNIKDDVRTVNFKKFGNCVVVDTIVEHFQDHAQWLKTLPPGTKVILQGNDMFDVPDHVNCHHTLEEFVAACDLSRVIWKGELSLQNCTRYMLIGTT